MNILPFLILLTLTYKEIVVRTSYEAEYQVKSDFLKQFVDQSRDLIKVNILGHTLKYT